MKATMRISSVATTVFFLLHTKSSHGLLSPTALHRLHRSGGARRILTSPTNYQQKHETSTLFSAAAISADGPYNSESALVESEKINYGPAIKLGKLKMNAFGLIFGIWEYFWGIFFWYPALTIYSLLRKLPGDPLGKLDPFRRIPIAIGYTWALLSMTLFGMWPGIVGRENLEVLREVDENGKKGKLKPAMYVANHSSWMDIVYVTRILAFSNYKFIAKAELLKVPVLGKACKVAGHVMLDRSNRKSQFQAYKLGIQWLKDGVNLFTFPEGTRSKNNGRMGSFKMGAFKMAQATGAPIVPLSISYAHKVQPNDYIFPAKSSRANPCKVTIEIGKPIETEGKDDGELLEEVWMAIANGLPASQKPEEGTPVGVK